MSDNDKDKETTVSLGKYGGFDIEVTERALQQMAAVIPADEDPGEFFEKLLKTMGEMGAVLKKIQDGEELTEEEQAFYNEHTPTKAEDE